MGLFGKKGAVLGAIVLAAHVSSASADEIGCRVHSNISSLVTESKNFLDYLGTGRVSETAWILERRLKSSATAELPQLLRQMDLAGFAAMTGVFLDQQNSLLRNYKQTGRRSAAQTADAIQASKQLNAVRRSLGKVPCASTANKSYSDGLAGGGVSSAVESIAKSGAFRLIAAMFVLGGVVIAVFGWFSQIGKRRTKRYSCLLPCTVISSEKMHPAMITNISRTGAKLDIDSGFEKGQRVEVNFMGESVQCRVVRHKNDQLAIDFDTMLHLEVLQKILNGVTAETVMSASVSPTAGN